MCIIVLLTIYFSDTRWESEHMIKSVGSSKESLSRSLVSNLNVTNEAADAMLQGADQKVYTSSTIPRLDNNQIWINGGHTKDWTNLSNVTGKQFIFVETNGIILPWLKISISDIMPLAKNAATFARAIHVLVEQLKNNIGASQMAKNFGQFDKPNADTHHSVYLQRKKDSEQLVTFIDIILKRQRKVISKNSSLFSKDLERIQEYRGKLKQL